MTQEDALLIDRPATSLFIETGKEASLPFLVSRLPLLFRANLETYKQKGLAPFILKLKNSMIHKVGDLISINKSEGAFLKIDDEGSLVIEINGKEVTFMSGEIH
jgi:biotin-(acetyl-CoA carboxylase) ligase